MKGKFFIITKKHILVSVLFISTVVIMCIVGSSNIENIIEVSVQNRLLPVYSVETDKKQVALTFDCAWGADDIPNIVDTLKRNKVDAVFFVVGDWVKKYPDAVKLLHDSKMEIRKSYIQPCSRG